MASVYIETTIPSYYYETRQAPLIVAWREATRTWCDQFRGEYRLFSSQAVRSELSRSPRTKARSALELLREATLLDEPAGLVEVMRYYVEQKLMPIDTGEGDAYHLAMASMCSMDFLLTWNCRHWANANKIQHVTVLNHRLGLHVPVITTPLSLMPETDL